MAALAVTAALLAASCGGESDGVAVPPEPVPPAEPPQASAEPAPPEPDTAPPAPPEPPGPAEPAPPPEPPGPPAPPPPESPPDPAPSEPSAPPPAPPGPAEPAPPPAPPEDPGPAERSAPAPGPELPTEDLAAVSQDPGSSAPPVDPGSPGTAGSPPWRPVTVLVAKESVNGIVPVYDAPGGDRLRFQDGEVWSYTFRGNRLVVRVLQGSEGEEWAQVELPVRPNGSRGWIRTEDFEWSTVRHHILIDVSDRFVALFEGDELVTSTHAIVGRPDTPTPTLRGFLVEKLPNHSRQNASEVLGDWILMLSFFSEALDSFGGGLPRIALHGTHIPDRVGEALSNGCIRIPNDIIETIAATAPLGTVVNISA